MLNESFTADSQDFLHLRPGQKCQVICKDLKNSYVYWSIRKAIKQEIIKPRNKNIELNELIPKLLKDLNLESQIKNQVFNICRKSNFFQQPSVSARTKLKDCTNFAMLPPYFRQKHVEPLDILAKTHQNWSEHLKQRFKIVVQNSMKRIYIKARKEPQKKSRKQSDGPVMGADDNSTTPSTIIQSNTDYSAPFRSVKVSDDNSAYIYDAQTLLEWILRIKNGNLAVNMMLSWSTIPLQIQTKSIEELRQTFAQMHLTLRQIGVDEQKSFIQERISIGQRILQKDYSPFIVQYAKRGIPNTLRSWIYKAVLGVQMTTKDTEFYQGLSENWQKWETGLDQMLRNDIKDMCNDDKYFIFQEIIHYTVLSFIHDPTVQDQLMALPNEPIIGIAGTDRQVGMVPPCGVLPCIYFSKLIAPLGYLSEKPEELYFIFKEMYC